jgi:hypothetical protein
MSPTSTVISWISVDDRLPDTSPNHTNRSITVLVCDSDAIVSAYYDSDFDAWCNDVLAETDEIVSVMVTHWAHIPFSPNDSKWISVAKSIPREASISDPKNSINVLTCTNDKNYSGSIMSAFRLLAFDDDSWISQFIASDVDAVWTPTHWMPMPELPQS